MAAAIGPVTLWATPDEQHPSFAQIAARFAIALARQADGDLGARMLAAIAAANGPALVIGTDCPALTAEHLRAAADMLRDGTDAVAIPAEDGGYALIGMRSPEPALFSDMRWSTPDVMGETRRRLAGAAADLARAGHAVGRGRAGGSRAPARERIAGVDPGRSVMRAQNGYCCGPVAIVIQRSSVNWSIAALPPKRP